MFFTLCLLYNLHYMYNQRKYQRKYQSYENMIHQISLSIRNLFPIHYKFLSKFTSYNSGQICHFTELKKPTNEMSKIGNMALIFINLVSMQFQIFGHFLSLVLVPIEADVTGNV